MDMQNKLALQKGGFKRKWRWKPSSILILAVFFIFALASLSIGVARGAVSIPLAEMGSILFLGEQSDHYGILMNIRLPRALVGAAVGINLALAGAILQGIMKNPLADPQIIGVNAGAGFVAITILILFPQSQWLLTPGAFIGAMLAAILVYALSWKNGIQTTRIILAGVAVASLLGAGVSGLLVFYSDRVHGAMQFIVGGLGTSSWPQLKIIAPYTIIGLLLALISSNRLNLLLLSDNNARSLGLNVEGNRLLLTALASLLAASAVSIVGLLGFVGLVVPHAARLMIGNNYRMLIPASALLGAGVVTLSDMIARTVFAPIELPVGIVMAAVGAPFFLYLLKRGG
ncbi:iron ABC transporter permease [Paenibacillus pinisoli]|uniref:Iron ABC transporter permease n=2 Tax=Paenibacillus pinisoli TaxID=1276110 RepID=A0A3A6PF10_9BACL|nr:iron ABC transporter permease [Paenibacillus pinisoli]